MNGGRILTAAVGFAAFEAFVIAAYAPSPFRWIWAGIGAAWVVFAIITYRNGE